MPAQRTIVPVSLISASKFVPNTTKPSKLLSNVTTPPQSIRCIVAMQYPHYRLGNRMFMVASAYGLARLHGCHLYLPPEVINELTQIFVFDVRHILLLPDMFNAIINSTEKPMKRISKYAVCEYDIELTRPNGIPHGFIFELTGYWQSYLYFAKNSDELREHLFAGTPSALQRISQFFSAVYQKHYDSKPQFLTTKHKILKQQLTELNGVSWIGVHIRRTDFVSLGIASTDEYLTVAMSYFIERYPKAIFIVASDDRLYCLKLFRNRSNIFVTPLSFSDGDDLIALSLCEHSIITGGTFGWWAAFLANGRVLHDKLYPSGCPRRELYYPPWFLLDGKVPAYMNSSYTY